MLRALLICPLLCPGRRPQCGRTFFSMKPRPLLPQQIRAPPPPRGSTYRGPESLSQSSLDAKPVIHFAFLFLARRCRSLSTLRERIGRILIISLFYYFFFFFERDGSPLSSPTARDSRTPVFPNSSFLRAQRVLDPFSLFVFEAI